MFKVNVPNYLSIFWIFNPILVNFNWITIFDFCRWFNYVHFCPFMICTNVKLNIYSYLQKMLILNMNDVMCYFSQCVVLQGKIVM